MAGVILQLVGAKKVGETWKIGAVAVATEDRTVPVADGTKIQFFMDLNPFGEPIETTNAGRAVQQFTGITDGEHFFEAQSVSSAVKSPIANYVFEEDKSTTDTITLTFQKLGVKPDYEIRFILSEPQENVEILVIDMSNENTPTVTIKTKASGTVRFKVPRFEGDCQRFLARVPSLGIEECVDIYQPQRPQQPEEEH